MTEDLWKIYDANKEWIKFADTKAIAFIAIIGVLFNGLYKIADEIISLSNYNIVKILYCASIVLLVGSLLLSVYCLLPRTSKTEGTDVNLIYYKSINDNFDSEEKYCDAINDENINFKGQLCVQNYQLASVAMTKYSIVKLSLILFAAGFVLIIIFMFLLKMGWSFDV